MNGRLADSLTGRFLSADPYVPDAGLTQSFNRYSYVNNNPLSMTDPSGFAGICVDSFSCAGSVVYSVFSFAKKLFGGRSKPPPPKGCFTNVGGTGCYGKAAATKLYEMARDIYGLPPLRPSSVWGVGDGRFGTGPCSWGLGCMSWDEGVVADGAAETEPVPPWRIPMPVWTHDPDVQRDIQRIWRTTGIALPWPKRLEQGALVIQRVWAKEDDYDVIKLRPSANDSISWFTPSWLRCLCRVVGKIHSHGGRGRDGQDPFTPSDNDLYTSKNLGIPGVIVTYPANPDEEYQLIPYDGRYK